MSRINDHSDVSCALLWLLLEDSSVTPHTSGCSKGSFPPGLFLTVYISVDPDFCCCRHLQDLSSWQEIQKWADLNEWFACHLLCIFPSQPSLACTESRKHTEVPGHFTCSQVPGAWGQTSNKIKLSLISLPDNLHGKTYLHDFSGFNQTLSKIHRYLQLLLLSKLWLAIPEQNLH